MVARTFHVKRVYDPPAADDGARVLVDRLWPRGLTKDAAKLTLWLKEIAPSTELRQWFHQHLDAWEAFQDRYRAELKKNATALTPLYELRKRGRVTLLYGVRDPKHNHARILAEYLRTHAAKH